MPEMQYVYMQVTPEQARLWLERNVRNRAMKPIKVANFVRMMREGLWIPNHQGISFDTHNVLNDGQNRLAAIAESGVTVEMWVCFNEPPEAQGVIDDGGVRSLYDRVRLAGGVIEDLSKDHIAVLRVPSSGPAAGGSGRRGDRGHLTTSEAADLLSKHRDALRFTFDVLPKGRAGVSDSITWGVIARAFYSADHIDLRNFAAILHSGRSSGDSRDASVTLLRDWLMKTRGGTIAQRVVKYGKVQRALAAYLNNEVLTRLHAAPHELFELPGHEAAELVQ